MNPLSSLSSNFQEFKELFEINRDKPLLDWLKFAPISAKSGKQGVVGILYDINNSNRKSIFKVSQYVDYLSAHEYSVMESLNEISSYCPHFCRTFGLVNTDRNPRFGVVDSNPFLKTDDVKYTIKEDVVLSEFVDSKNKLSNYVQSTRISDDILINTIKQVLLAISVAQTAKKFCHYDLHSQNIMMKKCNKDLVMIYVLDDDNQIYVPTNGHFPVIIDFGFSYVCDLEDRPLLTTLGHTSSGFTGNQFDHLRDPVLFLITMCSEMKDFRSRSKACRVLNKITKNMFGTLSIDWETGWDINNDKDLGDVICDNISDICKRKSVMFYEYANYCIDMLQSIIILPLEEQKYDKEQFRGSFKSFLNEWIKIENQISFDYYNLYILKSIIDISRMYRSEYMNKNTMDNAVLEFSRKVSEKVNEISKFCILSKVNFERMMCSLYVLANNMEGIMYEHMNRITNTKKKAYDKLPLQNVEQVYAAVESNIPSKYKFNEKTTVMVMDCKTKKTTLLKVQDPHEMNDVHNFCVGSYIYDLFKTKSERIEILN